MILLSVSRSDKKILHQMSDLLKRKHQLRLIELEESVLLAQVKYISLRGNLSSLFSLRIVYLTVL